MDNVSIVIHQTVFGQVVSSLSLSTNYYANVDPISDQKMSFFTPVSRPGL